MSSAVKGLWIVGAQHEAFGLEGLREVRTTERGARQIASRVARRGGYGWRPYVSPAEAMYQLAEAEVAS